VGYNVREDMKSQLVLEALERANSNACPAPGLLHHSDRGSQYASSSFKELLHSLGAAPSMSRKGNPYDNAMMESFFATLKAECFDHIPETKKMARLLLFDYIEGFYNTHRLHSSLGYTSPVNFENQFNNKHMQLT
jgi:transposase InsO family protein